jgi:hypothetical protein
MPEITKLSQISTHLERLEKSVCRCAQIVCELEGKLGRVLINQPEGPAEAVTDSSNLCHLAIELETFTQTSNGTISRLEDILSRLAL